jgi:hypothetical protein
MSTTGIGGGWSSGEGPEGFFGGGPFFGGSGRVGPLSSRRCMNLPMIIMRRKPTMTARRRTPAIVRMSRTLIPGALGSRGACEETDDVLEELAGTGSATVVTGRTPVILSTSSVVFRSRACRLTVYCPLPAYVC